MFLSRIRNRYRIQTHASKQLPDVNIVYAVYEQNERSHGLQKCPLIRYVTVTLSLRHREEDLKFAAAERPAALFPEVQVCSWVRKNDG